MVEHYHSAKRLSILGTVSLALLIGALPFRSTHAGPITFTGSISNRSASVTFEQIGKKLKVTLINTSTADVLAAPDVLTAVFFTVAGDPKLKRVSAVVPSGNTVLFGSTNKKGVVGGEWAYKNDLTGAPDGADEGISSAAFNLFGPKNRFPGRNLQGPKSPGGLEYGITSTNDNPITGSFDVTSDSALIKNTVVLVLKGLPKRWVLQTGSITSVGFQYGAGTALADPLANPYVPAQFENSQLIPEPSAFVLAGTGILLAALFIRKRR